MKESKLSELSRLCKCSVTIDINSHKDFYESVFENIEDPNREGIPKGLMNKMIEMDSIVRIQAYPRTPVGFCVVYHYDVDMAIDEMLDGIKNLNI